MLSQNVKKNKAPETFESVETAHKLVPQIGVFIMVAALSKVPDSAIYRPLGSFSKSLNNLKWV